MTNPLAEPLFIDTNVLVFANSISAPVSIDARSRLNDLSNQGSPLWISRQVLREYMATMSRSQTFQKSVHSASLIADIHRFQSQFLIAEDGPLVTDRLLKLIGSIPIGGKQIHDANIVATMLAHGLRRLLTHNVIDFQRFAGTIDLIPMI